MEGAFQQLVKVGPDCIHRLGPLRRTIARSPPTEPRPEHRQAKKPEIDQPIYRVGIRCLVQKWDQPERPADSSADKQGRRELVSLGLGFLANAAKPPTDH